MKRFRLYILFIIAFLAGSACSDTQFEGALMIMGDSISTEEYYATKLKSLLRPSAYYNIAVSGARWSDREGTFYDGHPQLNGSDANLNNVLGNQVQYVINNRDSFNPAPDVILIASGINDDISCVTDSCDAEIERFFTEEGRMIVISEPSFDDRDAYGHYRLKIAGAMRSSITRLQAVFPKAHIFVCTPVECCREISSYETVLVKQQLIAKTAHRIGVDVIPLGEECGIIGENEKLNANGMYLIDGLHPNNNGGWLIADYLAKFLKKCGR
ncbi:MAG: SGNH/GDSL hydrolase family protein [Bacteroidales bacterium]